MINIIFLPNTKNAGDMTSKLRFTNYIIINERDFFIRFRTVTHQASYKVSVILVTLVSLSQYKIPLKKDEIYLVKMFKKMILYYYYKSIKITRT